MSIPQSQEEIMPSPKHKTSPQADEEVVSNALVPGDMANLGAERNSQGNNADMGAERASRDSQQMVSTFLAQ